VRVLRFVAAIALLAPQLARAQAAPYLPMDDISYSYVDALMSRVGATLAGEIRVSGRVRGHSTAPEPSLH